MRYTVYYLENLDILVGSEQTTRTCTNTHKLTNTHNQTRTNTLRHIDLFCTPQHDMLPSIDAVVPLPVKKLYPSTFLILYILHIAAMSAQGLLYRSRSMTCTEQQYTQIRESTTKIKAVVMTMAYPGGLETDSFHQSMDGSIVSVHVQNPAVWN